MDCGECTACCDLFPIGPINKPANSPCQFCDGGCSIHSAKPQICDDFECSYYQASDVPENLRPDKCGIIFSKKTDRIFSGALVPGASVTNLAKQQIQSFMRDGYAVVLVSVDEPKPHIMSADGRPAHKIYEEYVEAIHANV